MDDQRLKELLSAWFDGELDPKTASEVEAFVERSDEAKRIVAGFKKLKQLSDESALNPRSDYWERSAARIEAALTDETATSITPVKRPTWYDWSWRIVSLAASVALLTYVGFHSEEILRQVRQSEQPPETTNVITKEPIEKKPVQESRPEVILDKKDEADLQEPAVTIEKPVKPETPLPTPKRVRASDSLRVKAVPSPEPSAGEEKTTASDQLLRSTITKSMETNLGASSPKPAVVDSVSAAAPTPPPPKPVGKARLGESVTSAAQAEQEGVTASPNYKLADNLAESIPSDTVKAPTQEEQYQYLWDHVVVQQLAAMKAKRPNIYNSFSGGDINLSSGLTSTKKSSRAGKDKGAAKADNRAKEREKELIDAAYYVGKLNKGKNDREQALSYLKYMAEENQETIDRPYARRKWEELEERR